MCEFSGAAEGDPWRPPTGVPMGIVVPLADRVHAKAQHGLHRAARGERWNVAIQSYLTAAVINLKRLAKAALRAGIEALMPWLVERLTLSVRFELVNQFLPTNFTPPIPSSRKRGFFNRPATRLFLRPFPADFGHRRARTGPDQWIICHTHHTKSYVESNLFSSWRDQTEEDWERNRATLEGYPDVKCEHPKNPTNTNGIQPCVVTQAEAIPK